MAEEPLKKIVDNLEKEAEALDDQGHKNLVEDLASLKADSEAGKFHDFHANGEATPKLALMERLSELMRNVQGGKYDN